MERKVDRHLKDKAMDRIDHALGRPVNPMGETYRDHFAIGEGALADEFRASPNWALTGKSGTMLFFSVTDAGREALRDHLRNIGDKHRVYIVSYDGYDMEQVATSASKARYAKYLDLSDVRSDLTFKQFQASARVRLA